MQTQMNMETDTKKGRGVGILVVILILVVAAGAVFAVRGLRRLRSGPSIREYADAAQEVETKVASIRKKMDIERAREQPVPEPRPVAKQPEAAKPAAATEEVATEQAEEGAVDELQLTGIVWSPTQPLAFVNGEAMRLQDRLGGLTLVAIEKESVRFSDEDGNVRVLNLYEE